MRTILLCVNESQQGQRIDSFLASVLDDVSRTQAARLCDGGHVLLGGAQVQKRALVRAGDEVAVTLPDPVPLAAQPQAIPIDVVYEDESLAVINKPKGMVVHPAAGNPDGTLVNAILARFGDLSGIGGVQRPGIVHRIDKDTSGLLVIAKNDRAHQSLSAQLKAHTMERVYQAVVVGRLPEPEGRIDAPIGRSGADRKKMAVTDKNAKNAATNYRVLAEYPGYSHVECRLETGRTHQIRVHMSHIGHPLAGDRVYGAGKNPFGLDSQCLHAKVLGFTHPVTGERLVFDSELPPYLRRVLTILENSI